jgi:hypothetical protein
LHDDKQAVAEAIVVVISKGATVVVRLVIVPNLVSAEEASPPILSKVGSQF